MYNIQFHKICILYDIVYTIYSVNSLLSLSILLCLPISIFKKISRWRAIAYPRAN